MNAVTIQIGFSCEVYKLLSAHPIHVSCYWTKIFTVIKFVIYGIYYLDIDECSLKISDCHDDAICTNMIGSFSCQCREGFTGDGSNCQGRDKLIFLINVSKLKKIKNAFQK